MRILAIFGALVLGALLIVLGAGGAIWYTKQQTDEIGSNRASSDSTEAAPGDLVHTAGADQKRSGAALDRIDLQRITDLLSVLDDHRRKAILESADRFAEFIRLEATNQSVLSAAYANGADEQPAVHTLMERASQKILAEAYLNKVVRLNSDPEFPTEEDIKDFYDKHQESFQLPDRVHIWQIFMPIPADTPADEQEKARLEVGRIVNSIRKGKADFTSMVEAHSRHAQSRLNDGYMGLLKISDLLPEIRATVEKLKAGAVSDPLRTKTGFHIIKRGAFVAGSTLKLEDANQQIRKQLRQQAAQRIRQAAVEKIVASFPVEVPGSALEEWRVELLGQVSSQPAEMPGSGSQKSAQEAPL